MKSISARFSISRTDKSKKSQPTQTRLSIDDDLRSLVARAAATTGVTSVELHVKISSLDLTYSPESDVWESKFPKHFETRIVLNILSGFSDEQVSLNSERLMYVFHYDASSSSIVWEKGTSQTTDILKSRGFERAQTVFGPFPVRYILDYLNLSQFKVFASPTRNDAVHVSIFTERDFSIQLMEFLEHLQTTRHSGDRSNTPSRDVFRYQIQMQSSISLLSVESEQINRVGAEHSQHPRIHRVF